MLDRLIKLLFSSILLDSVTLRICYKYSNHHTLIAVTSWKLNPLSANPIKCWLAVIRCYVKSAIRQSGTTGWGNLVRIWRFPTHTPVCILTVCGTNLIDGLYVIFQVLGVAEKATSGGWGFSLVNCLNPFLPKVTFLYPLKTPENLEVFWCFQEVYECNIGYCSRTNYISSSIKSMTSFWHFYC